MHIDSSSQEDEESQASENDTQMNDDALWMIYQGYKKNFSWHQLTFDLFQFVFKSIATTLAFEVRDLLHIWKAYNLFVLCPDLQVTSLSLRETLA